MEGFFERAASAAQYGLAHKVCLLNDPAWIRIYFWSDFFIFLSYLLIGGLLLYASYRASITPVRHLVYGLFGVFIISCGFVHGTEVVGLVTPFIVAIGGTKIVTAIVSVTAAVVTYVLYFNGHLSVLFRD